MPSCSTSSNIASSINALSVSQGGSRLSLQIPFLSGLTVGNVIRYDVATTGYTASKADDAERSEVFGVIENYDSSVGKFNVVIYGSINISSAYLSDMGSGGGCGGNDIYFLSGVTAGRLQNLAPTKLDHIVKPIYQASPHGNGSYTGVIVNYLGYKLGGEILASSENSQSLIGEITTFVGTDFEFEPGVVDASISHDLPVADYPEFYERFGTEYGYVEKLTINTVPSGIAINQPIIQANSSYAGKVKAVDLINNFVYVTKAAGSDLSSVNKNARINGLNFAISATSVHSAFTPIVTIPQQFIVSANDGTRLQSSQTIKVGLRIRPIGLRVEIPTTIETSSSITASEFFVGNTPINIETYITDLNTRVAAIETRLKM